MFDGFRGALTADATREEPLFEREAGTTLYPMPFRTAAAIRRFGTIWGPYVAQASGITQNRAFAS
ncbi:hypothetical protein V475_19665 [Sphingobium baderi LL03]|nr:hypothetical protein V475_19665 [Sphingobium baderi LL03]